DVTVEKIALHLGISAPRMADIRVGLISPDGTESVLLRNAGFVDLNPADGVPDGTPASINEPGQNSLMGGWTLTSNAFRGESSLGQSGQGIWTVVITDTIDNSSNDDATIFSADLVAYGSNDTPDDTYIFTDEFADVYRQAAINNDPSRLLL